MFSLKSIRLLLLISPLILCLCGCQSKSGANEVVVYTSLDQIFSEPILKDFERQTSIKVKALYDTEATKTVGMANRLIAEKDNPQADVFWNSEIVRTILLKKKKVLSPYFSPSAKTIPANFKDPEGYWTGFAARARVLVVNRNLVKEGQYPSSLQDLLLPEWQGKAGLGLPLFGTTNTQALALYQLWGIKPTEEFFRRCLANRVQVLAGNSVVRDRVADGSLAFGLTDSDDVFVGQKRGKPIAMVYLDQKTLGTLLIPNSVSLIAGCPNPANGKKLIDFLLSEKVEESLAFADSQQIPLRSQVKRPPQCPKLTVIKTMAINYDALADNVEEYSTRMRNIFLQK